MLALHINDLSVLLFLGAHQISTCLGQWLKGKRWWWVPLKVPHDKGLQRAGYGLKSSHLVTCKQLAETICWRFYGWQWHFKNATTFKKATTPSTKLYKPLELFFIMWSYRLCKINYVDIKYVFCCWCLSKDHIHLFQLCVWPQQQIKNIHVAIIIIKKKKVFGMGMGEERYIERAGNLPQHAIQEVNVLIHGKFLDGHCPLKLAPVLVLIYWRNVKYDTIKVFNRRFCVVLRDGGL